MLTVKRVQGSGQFQAKVGVYGTSVCGSSPSDALFRLERYAGLDSVYRPYVREIHKRYSAWQISDAELSAGINTGTIILAQQGVRQ